MLKLRYGDHKGVILRGKGIGVAWHSSKDFGGKDVNKYLMEISKYFGGKIEFTIDATDKADALEKAKERVSSSHEFDDCKKDTIKVVKKLQAA